MYEDGFSTEIFTGLDKDELIKLLKKLQKKEFPRSNMVRFYEENKAKLYNKH